MTDPHSTIPEHAQPALWRRYENYRAQRYERTLARYRGRYPRLRNRRAFRRLALTLVGFLGLVLASAIVAFIVGYWLFIPFIIGLVGVVALMSILRVVTGSVADAPVSALDEIQLAQRNSARSLGYIVLFSLMFIPYLLLIFLGSARDQIPGHTVYAIGILLISLVLIGSCTPIILTSWWQADPDPEDFAPEIDGATADVAAPSQPATEKGRS